VKRESNYGVMYIIKILIFFIVILKIILNFLFSYLDLFISFQFFNF
jgi:hypothetical protein